MTGNWVRSCVGSCVLAVGIMPVGFMAFWPTTALAADEARGLSPQESAAGWLPLFDGRSLDGWENTSDADWQVKDGALAASRGTPGLLVTTRDWGDFALRLEFRASPATNSGVFLRTPPKPTDPAKDCYELNIADPTLSPFPTGSFVNRLRTGSPPAGDDAWHAFDLTAEGGRFRVSLDGRPALDYVDPQPLGRGRIGLQFRAGAIEFRNIRLRPLGLEPGARAVVIRPTSLRTTTEQDAPLAPGTSLTIQSPGADRTEQSRLSVAAGRLGTIDAGAVIAADQADAHFSAAIEKQPDDAAALVARGRLRFDRGELDAAIVDLDRALKLAPSSEAFTFRGFAWKRKGDKDRAMADFDEAIRLDPRNALAWRVRGATWAGKADYQKAVADYSESIRIDPENPDSLHHRAVMLGACNDAGVRDGKQSLADATKACEVSGWKNPLYLIGLAIASAELGDFDDAVRWQTKAIELTPGAAPKTMQEPLELYRKGQPFRTTWR